MIQNKLSLGQLNAPLTLEHFYKGPKTRSRRAGYSYAITHRNNETLAHYTTSPAQTFDSYTWPDSLAPSRNITPIPLPRRLPVKKQAGCLSLPGSSRLLSSATKKSEG